MKYKDCEDRLRQLFLNNLPVDIATEEDLFDSNIVEEITSFIYENFGLEPDEPKFSYRPEPEDGVDPNYEAAVADLHPQFGGLSPAEYDAQRDEGKFEVGDFPDEVG